MANFKEGDVVVLKSGGSRMTIDKVEQQGEMVSVKWFAGSKMESARVRTSSIEAAPAPAAKP